MIFVDQFVTAWKFTRVVERLYVVDVQLLKVD